MDAWLKWLIAAACCVVIAAGGYYAWSEYWRSVEEKRIAEYRAWRQICDLMLDEMKAGQFTQDWRVLHITKCVVDGYLRESDFDAPLLRGYLENARSSIDYDRSKKSK